MSEMSELKVDTFKPPPPAPPIPKQIIKSQESQNIPTQSTGKNEVSTEQNQEKNNNTINTIIYKHRNVYVIGQTKKDPNIYLAIQENKELIFVQKGKDKDGNEQEIHTDFNHLLVNACHISTDSKIKVVSTGQIMKGKVFPIDMDSLHKQITKKKIDLVRSGKFTEPLTDTQLKNQKEESVVEHLVGKVMWMSPKAFQNGELNIKIWTETGFKLLLILDPKYHTAVETGKVYRFIQIRKPTQWTSGSPLLKEVQLKLKTRTNTKIELIKLPSPTFRELGKEVGQVLWVDQNIIIFDQCVECWKSKWNSQCRNEGCPEMGKTTPENPMFNLGLVINTQADEAITVKVWWREIVDLPKEFRPSLEPDVGVVVTLVELERHFGFGFGNTEGKFITYRSGNMEGNNLVIKDVALKLPTSMDFDV